MFLIANDLKKKKKEIALEKYTAFCANRQYSLKNNQIKAFEDIPSYAQLGFKTQNMNMAASSPGVAPWSSAMRFGLWD